MQSEVIFKNTHYTACVMGDGSLIVTKNHVKGGRRLDGVSAPFWIADIKNAVDKREAAMLCRAIFNA